MLMADSLPGGTWGSVLSADAFAAVRSVGFEPVAQAFGAAAHHLSTTEGTGCPGAAARSRPRDGPAATAGATLVTVSGQGIPGPAARVARAMYSGPADGDRPDGKGVR